MSTWGVSISEGHKSREERTKTETRRDSPSNRRNPEHQREQIRPVRLQRIGGQSIPRLDEVQLRRESLGDLA